MKLWTGPEFKKKNRKGGGGSVGAGLPSLAVICLSQRPFGNILPLRTHTHTRFFFGDRCGRLKVDHSGGSLQTQVEPDGWGPWGWEWKGGEWALLGD